MSEAPQVRKEEHAKATRVRSVERAKANGTVPIYLMHRRSLPCVVASSTGPVMAGGVPARGQRPDGSVAAACPSCGLLTAIVNTRP
ncbi:hypothetical protein [Streptomyces lincolnensis]|uniref:hypothetical protein n=1 Tax=Streptomyces lincolnensis TaxID=1915 RepID=UPI00082C2063|nr:hypothetical protein [Streptomyces lincolnensis]QMV04341.1 hypothetical protein GJU35_00650 [Streptomyces lincolnensis]QMV11982.1 hypothetical protein GJU35_44270 [Streptomyces lincolnensis]